MTIIKTTIDGQEREFEMAGPSQFQTTHGIDRDGHITEIGTSSPTVVYLHLVQPRHTFGGVVFEETGEYRRPLVNEWHFYDSKSVICHNTYEASKKHTILRPVTLEGPLVSSRWDDLLGLVAKYLRQLPSTAQARWIEDLRIMLGLLPKDE